VNSLNRPRYQHGFFSRQKRKKGPEVWVYRWRDIDANGNPKMRSFVVGSVKQYSTEAAAWKAVSTLRLDINHHTFRPEGHPETFEQLVEHYRMIELDLEKASERKVRQTKQTYGIYLKTRIVPRWGSSRFQEIKAVGVERWLGSIDDLSNGTKSKIKCIMSEVFQHAIRYGWLNDGENPIFAVRQGSKRVRVTEPLEAAELRMLILELPPKMRVIGIVAATTGLRISEVLGLKWKDIDWEKLQMEVTRSVVDGVIGKCKTETSRRPVPIDEFTTDELLSWRRETTYAEPEDWVFASEKVQGRMPPWADTLLDRFLQPAAKRAGITKWVGFHTFRHTYSTLLKANGEDVKVVQELMRHANISTTMNIYTKALTPAKREAQSRVVDVLLDRSRNVAERAVENAAREPTYRRRIAFFGGLP
jgi:integrase